MQAASTPSPCCAARPMKQGSRTKPAYGSVRTEWLGAQGPAQAAQSVSASSRVAMASAVPQANQTAEQNSNAEPRMQSAVLTANKLGQTVWPFPELGSDIDSAVWPAIEVPCGMRCSSITVLRDKLEVQVVPCPPNSPPGNRASTSQIANTSATSSPPPQKQQTVSRLVLQHGEQMFVTVGFGQFTQARDLPKKKIASYIEKVLSIGLTINGGAYHFIGSSGSQLRERTAVFYRCNSSEQAWRFLQCWGELYKIKSVAKLYKRVGLLFSGISPITLYKAYDSYTARPTVEQHWEVQDIERNGFCFTDGCGIISHHLASSIMAARGKLRLPTGRTYLPSVYQFRYKGYKGVVHIDTPEHTFMSGIIGCKAAGCDILLRKSQRKVDGVSDDTFGLVEVSQPYKFGYLNEQFIVLLSALGIPDEVLLQRQAEYFQELQMMSSDAYLATRYLLMEGKLSEAEMVAGLPDDSRLPTAIAKQVESICSREVNRCLKQDKRSANSNNNSNINIKTVAADIAPRLDQSTGNNSAAVTAGSSQGRSNNSRSLSMPGTNNSTATEMPRYNCGGKYNGRQTGRDVGRLGSRLAAPRYQAASGPSGIHVAQPPAAEAAAQPHSASQAKSANTASSSDDESDVLGQPNVKLRVRIQQSRLAFGIPDPTGELEYGTAFFQPTVDDEATVLTGCALVARAPSYHPGDLRVLELMDVPELRALKDVLVFPVQGPRPHADECSGGDYDGDQFFVCWDEGLIPSRTKLYVPMDYSGSAEAINAKVDHQALVKYFAEHDPSILGRLNSCYMYWAEQKGPGCKECMKLAELFSQGVDSVKSGVKTAVPAWLRPPRPVAATDSLSAGSENDSADNTPASKGSSPQVEICVWKELLNRARTFVHSWRQARLAGGNSTSITSGLSYEDMLDLLDRRDISAREYDLFRLALSWIEQHGASTGVSLLQLVDNLDFSKMSREQCEHAIAAGVPPEMVFNDITRSQLLTAHQTGQLGSIGKLPWRLYDAGDFTSNSAWQKLFTAATKFPKKLLLLQCHQPHQTIVLYLPHQYPGEGVFPCVTLRSDGQSLSAITWAFGVDGYSSMQRLSGHYIDLDFSEQRLQVYRPPALEPGEFVPLRDRKGDRPTKLRSYLWLRRMRRPVETRTVRQQQRSPTHHLRQQTYKPRQQGVSSLCNQQQQQGQRAVPVSSHDLSSQRSSRASNMSHAVHHLDQLLVSVDVQRFDPTKRFTHFVKTTKASVSRYELYATSCETLEHPILDMPETLQAFYATPSSQAASSSNSTTSSSNCLVAAMQKASDDQIDRANQLLQLLPGAHVRTVPAVDGSDSPAKAPLVKPSPVPPPAAAAAAAKWSKLQRTFPGPSTSLQHDKQQLAPAGAMDHRRRLEQQPAAAASTMQLSATEAAKSMLELVVQLSEEGKLELAVRLCEEVSGIAEPSIVASTASLWPRTWTAVISCAARLHCSDLAAQLVHAMLQSQLRTLQLQPEPQPTLQRNQRSIPATLVLCEAVKLCSNLGLLCCCPSVVFAFWSFLQQHAQAAGGIAAILATLPDGILFELVLAAIRITGLMPEMSGPILRQLLTCPALNWSPMRFVELMEAAITQCSNRTAAEAVAAAAAAVLAPVNSTESPLAKAAYKYMLHFGEALTVQQLRELQDVSTPMQQPSPGCSTGSGSKMHTNGSRGSTLHEHLLASARRQNNKPIITQLQRGLNSPHVLQPGSHSIVIRYAHVVESTANGTTAADGGPTACSSGSNTSAGITHQAAGNGSNSHLSLPCQVTVSSNGASQLQIDDLVYMMPQNLPEDLMSKPNYSITGRVVAVDKNARTAKIELPWQPVSVTEQLWQIQVLGNTTTYKRCMQGLCKMVQQLLPVAQSVSRTPGASASNSAGVVGVCGITHTHVLQQIIAASWYQQHNDSSISSGESSSMLQQLKAAAVQPVGADVLNGSPSGMLAESITGNTGGAHLNQAQQTAVLAAATQVLTLIWGPPGTGKTHTIVQLLLYMLAQMQAGMRSPNPILVCAETHTAVDNIMAKLLTFAAAGSPGGAQLTEQDVLRIGNVDRVAKELRSCTVDALGDEVTNATGFIDRKKFKNLLKSRKVVFATCAAAGASALIAVAQTGAMFQTVIVDEATQVVEPCCLLPILLGPAAQLVLVGDHKQLGPCVDPSAQDYDLHVPLFERLVNSGVVEPHMLQIQYRMHPDIAALPSACFYESKLLTQYNKQACIQLPAPLLPGISCFHVDGIERSRGTSNYNLEEVSIVKKLLRHLLTSRNTTGCSSTAAIQAGQIGIIAPYKAMVAELVQVAQSVPGGKGVEINTVDAFQGREKAIIIFCAVRSNRSGQLGFVSCERRLNVAMTRAQHALILIGNTETLQSNETWSKWVKSAHKVDFD